MPSTVDRLFVALILLTSLAWVPAAISGPARGEICWTADVTVSGTESFVSEKITLCGNLTVTGSLALSNVELVIDGPGNGSRLIEVGKGGTFKVQGGSRIRSTDPNVHFNFLVQDGGTLDFDQSTLQDCGWEMTGEQGLVLLSDKASVTNSSITENWVGIVVDSSSSPCIRGNNISSNAYIGIEVLDGSAPVIDRNIISSNSLQVAPSYFGRDAGIFSDASSPAITNSTIAMNGAYGMKLWTSGSPVIRGNTITGHHEPGGFGWGILSNSNDAHIERNIFSQNDNGLSLDTGSCTVSDNLFDNNTSPTSYYCMALLDMSSSDFCNNTYRNGPKGVCPSAGSFSMFKNETMQNCTNGYFGKCWGLPDYDVVLTNCTFTGNRYDVTLDWEQYFAMGGHLTLVNASYDPAKVNFLDPCGELTIMWFLSALVVYQNGSVPVGDAAVKVTDSTGSPAGHLRTGPDGRTPELMVEQYTKTPQGTTTLSPYNVSAEKGDKSAFTGGVALASNREVTVTLDDLPPMIRITSPTNGSVTSRAKISVSGFSEPRTSVAINGADVTVRADGSWSTSLDLTGEGPNTIVADAVDPSGNRAGDRVTVFLDSVVPVISVTAPRDRFLTNRSTVTVSGRVSEPHAATTIDGVAVTAGTDGSFSVPVDLAEGANVITICCEDAARNRATVYINGELDTVPPALGVSEPRNGLSTGKTSVAVKGVVEEGATLTLNGGGLVPDSGRFSASVELAEGSNTLKLLARDRAGNVNLSVLEVFRDTTGPNLEISYPAEGQLLNVTQIELAGRTEAGARLEVNGEPVAFQGTDFLVPVRFSGDGPQTITIEAQDALRNRAAVSVSITVDTTPPSLKLKTPADGMLTNQTAVLLTGKTDRGALLTVNGATARVDGDGTFSELVELPNEGANEIFVCARDAANNCARSAVVVHRDTILGYELSSPLNGSRVKTPVVTVAGVIEAGGSVAVNGLAVPLRADGSFSYEAKLETGSNILVVAFRDSAGNTATETVQITREKAPAPARGFISGFTTVAALAAAASALVAVGVLRRKGY